MLFVIITITIFVIWALKHQDISFKPPAKRRQEPESKPKRPIPGRSDRKLEDDYFKLTGVNIEEQKAIWDERGRGYYGEFLVLERLFYEVPGACKFLMNVEVPTANGRTTEIDLLMIHETGIYVFEVKHHQGTILGKDSDQTWTQHFKVAGNYTFNNPIRQNDYHIAALRHTLGALGIPNTAEAALQSVVVFTHDDVDTSHLKVQRKDVLVTRVYNLVANMWPLLAQTAQWDVHQIDQVWNYLAKYANTQPSPEILSHIPPTPLHIYIDVLKQEHENQEQRVAEALSKWDETVAQAIQKHEQDLIAAQKAAKKHTKRIAIFATTACLLVGVTAVGYGANQKEKHEAVAFAAIQEETARAEAKVEQYKSDADAAQAELQRFAEKWEYITDFEIDGTALKKDFVVVDYATLENSADFGDMCYLSFAITHNGEDFYALIDKNSSFVILLKNGRVIETPCYSSYSHYSLGYSKSAKTLKINRLELGGFSAEDVASIKMTNIQIKRIKYTYGEKPALTDYEIVLYNSMLNNK